MMKLTNLFKSLSSLKNIEYMRRDNIPYVKYYFHMKIGDISIQLQQADKDLIILTIYDPRKISNIVYGEKDFFDDISKIIKIIDTSEKGEDSFYYAYDNFCQLHIEQYHRLIDTDCFRIVAEFTELMSSVAAFGNESFNTSDKVDVFRMLINRAANKYSDCFYVTKYRRNGLNIEPYLVKFSDL